MADGEAKISISDFRVKMSDALRTRTERKVPRLSRQKEARDANDRAGRRARAALPAKRLDGWESEINLKISRPARVIPRRLR